LGEVLEVPLDDIAVLRRHVAGQLGHGGDAFLLGKLAPLLGQALEALLVDVAGAAVVGDVAVLHGAGGLVGAGAAAGSAATAAARRAAATTATAAALLLLELLDDLVEAGDDFLLLLLGLRAAAGQRETPLDVVHLASDPAQVLVLPCPHVV